MSRNGADILRRVTPVEGTRRSRGGEERIVSVRPSGRVRPTIPVRFPPPPPVRSPVTDPGSGVRPTTIVNTGPVPMREIEHQAVFSDPMTTGVSRPMGEPFVSRGRIIGALGGFLGGGPVGALTGFLGGGGGGETSSAFTGADRGQGLGRPPGCPPTTQRNPRTGACEQTGVVAAVQRFVPGGATGVLPDEFGEAVMGGFGVPALVPAQVGSITRRDGSVGPILRCPPGSVLAVDNLCYNKGVKGLAAFRKWKPGTRPFLTGGEVRILRRAETLRSGKGTKKTLKALGLGG